MENLCIKKGRIIYKTSSITQKIINADLSEMKIDNIYMFHIASSSLGNYGFLFPSGESFRGSLLHDTSVNALVIDIDIYKSTINLYGSLENVNGLYIMECNLF